MSTRVFAIRCLTCYHVFWRKYPANPDTFRPYKCPKEFKEPHRTECMTAIEQMLYVHRINQRKQRIQEIGE